MVEVKIDLPQPDIASLAMVQPDAIQQLFDKDPLEITDEELDRLVLHFRETRGKFLAQEEQKRLSGRKKKDTPETAGLNLKDLNITF